jgi:hypothetical protein
MIQRTIDSAVLDRERGAHLPRKPEDDETTMKAMYIRKDQDDFLRWRAYSKRVSQTESIRQAIDAMMDKDKEWQKSKG